MASHVARLSRKRSRPHQLEWEDDAVAFSDRRTAAVSIKGAVTCRRRLGASTFVNNKARTGCSQDEIQNTQQRSSRSLNSTIKSAPNKRISISSHSNNNNNNNNCFVSVSPSSALRSPSLALPILLDQRQRGIWRQNNHRKQQQQHHRFSCSNSSSWRDSVLLKNEKEQQRDDINNNNNKWRDHVRRTVPFSHLQTPHCDAILAIDRHGSYVIAVSEGQEAVGVGAINDRNNNNRNSKHQLALRFYGVPSPANLQPKYDSLLPLRNAQRSALLLQTTTPLVAVADPFVDQNRVQRSLNNMMLDAVMGSNSAFAASTPLRILIAADWRMGAVFLRHSATETSESNSFESTGITSASDDCLGTLTLFSLPRMNLAATGSLRTFQCANVRIAAWNAFTMRNLLWPVTVIPVASNNSTKRSSVSAIHHVRETPGYLLLNDEDDGFRLTWVVDSDWRQTPGRGVPVPEEPLLSVKPTRSDIVTVPSQCAWEVHHTATRGDQLWDERIEIDGGISVACEAFFSVEALLSDILDRRKHLLPTRPSTDARPIFPDFSYSLIAVSTCGRMVDLIITFESKKSTAVGVFLRVDLFTQSYDELDWIRNTSSSSNNNNSAQAKARSLQNWSNFLALHRRARQVRVGPFCVGPDHDFFGHWGPLRGEVFFERYLQAQRDDPVQNQKEWQDYLDGLKWNAAPDTSNLMPPTRISYQLLYPGCEMITNVAVTKGIPIAQMRCRDAPVVLVYE